VVRLHSGDVWPEAERNAWLELPEGPIYKDKDEAANRRSLPTLRALFFFQGNAKIRSGYPGSPQVAPGEPTSIV
jgi:hypothetical protein